MAGKRILIVDDNATNRRILTLQTQSWGMLPQAASAGSEALEWLRRGDLFDVAILDMQMPDMDGLSLTTEIRRHHEASTLPVIMLSSLGRRERPRGRSESPHFDLAAFLTKPIKPSSLYEVLVTVLAGEPRRVEPIARPQVDTTLAEQVPLRILLAEDNLINQKVALRILDRMGYRADIAANGLEVLQALQRQPYDVVLMDVQMPQMDGLEATRLICQQWPRTERPRIIAMTANAMQQDREACLSAGMDDFLSKPVRIVELETALKRCQPGAAPEADTPATPRYK